jgi:hypothetical protein
MTEFTEHESLNRVLKKVLDRKDLHELDPIREQEMKIEALLKTKTSKEGETQPCGGPPTNIVKVSGLWTLYTEARYILVVDGYFFNHCADDVVEGMVFNALQKIDVKIVKGEIKLASRRPDIEIFAATVAHYGPISDALIALKECFARGVKHFVSTIASGKLEETPSAVEEEPTQVDAAAEEAPARRGGRRK